MVRLRDTCEHALREQELARQREAALRDHLDRAQRQFEGGALHDALATLDDLHHIDAFPYRATRIVPKPSRSGCRIGEALAAEERELRRQFVAGEIRRVRAEIDRDEYRQAIDRLAALEREEEWSAEISELRIVAEEGLAESELLAARARVLSEHVAAAASLFAQNDLQGSLGRVQAALAARARSRARAGASRHDREPRARTGRAAAIPRPSGAPDRGRRRGAAAGIIAGRAGRNLRARAGPG